MVSGNSICGKIQYLVKLAIQYIPVRNSRIVVELKPDMQLFTNVKLKMLNKSRVLHVNAATTK
jgi:hypothetical protein